MKLVFRGKIVKTLFLQTMIVMIVGIVISTLGMMIDGIIISNLMGKSCMAAYGLVMPIFSAFSALGNVFATGMQAVCAKHLGKGEVEKTRRVFSVIVYFVTLLIAILIILSLIFQNQIAYFLGAKGNLIDLHHDVKTYFIGLVIGLPFIVGVTMFTPLVQLDGGQTKVIVATLLMSFSNIAADLINYYVFHGGMFGMALATSISYCISFTYLLFHFLRKDSLFKFNLNGIDFQIVGEVIVIGLPGAVSILCTTIRGFGINQILRLISGTDAIAAYTVMGSIGSFTSAITMGIGMATTTLAGIYFGEEDKKCLKRLLNVGIKYALIGTGIVTCVLFLFPNIFVQLFLHSDEAGAVSMAISGLRLHAISMPLYAIVYLMMSFMQGTENPKMANLICILDNLVFKLIAAVVLGIVMNVTGVWLSSIASEIMMLVMLFIIVWSKYKRIPTTLMDCMLLPEDFGVPEADEMEASIDSIEELNELVDMTHKWGTQNGMSDVQDDAIEEVIKTIGTNVLNQKLKGGRTPYLEVRLIRDKDGVTLRLKDNGNAVDTVKIVEDAKEGLVEENPSYAALISAFTALKSTKYTNTMGVNNTIIQC